MANFIKLHLYEDNLPVIVRIDTIVSVMASDDGTQLFLESENISDITVHESVDKIFDMLKRKTDDSHSESKSKTK